MISSHVQAMHLPRRKLASAMAGLALFAVVFILALLVEHPRPGILHLHAVPIAVLALQLGILVGVSAVAASLSLMFVWAEMEGIELLMVDYMSGAVPFLVVVFLCQLVVARASRTTTDSSAKRRPLLDRVRKSSVPELTPREKEVLGLLALGYTNRQAAEHLYLSVRTVESHRARIQQKLDTSSRAELVSYALDHDLLSEPPLRTRELAPSQSHASAGDTSGDLA
jgi:DNA-binding CsgD family transcriptional regulator